MPVVSLTDSCCSNPATTHIYCFKLQCMRRAVLSINRIIVQCLAVNVCCLCRSMTSPCYVNSMPTCISHKQACKGVCLEPSRLDSTALTSRPRPHRELCLDQHICSSRSTASMAFPNCSCHLKLIHCDTPCCTFT